MDWVKFPLAIWYRTTRGMSDAEKGALMDMTIDALVDEETGISPIADKLLEETRAYIDQARESGRKGGLKRVENAAKRSQATLSDPQATLSDPQATLSDPQGPSTHTSKQAYKQASKQNSTLSGASRATRADAGATPAPPADSDGGLPANLEPGLAEKLTEAMKDAPLNPGEALAYATSVHCGLTPPQVLEWAEWNAGRGWKRDFNGTLHPLDAESAKSSMRRWKNKQPEIEQLKKARLASAGGRVGGDATIRGVRIANRGGGLADKAGF